MFTNDRYMTRGVLAEIPAEIQIMIWAAIGAAIKSGVELDYLQVFELTVENGRQKIRHFQERPNREKIYYYNILSPITKKVYVIDDGDHSTMLLAEEY